MDLQTQTNHVFGNVYSLSSWFMWFFQQFWKSLSISINWLCPFVNVSRFCALEKLKSDRCLPVRRGTWAEKIKCKKTQLWQILAVNPSEDIHIKVMGRKKCVFQDPCCCHSDTKRRIGRRGHQSFLWCHTNYKIEISWFDMWSNPDFCSKQWTYGPT